MSNMPAVVRLIKILENSTIDKHTKLDEIMSVKDHGYISPEDANDLVSEYIRTKPDAKIREIYEGTFQVTETLKNGKERTFNKTVYLTLSDAETYDPDMYYKIKAAQAELEYRLYYNIICKDVKPSKILIV